MTDDREVRPFVVKMLGRTLDQAQKGRSLTDLSREKGLYVGDDPELSGVSWPRPEELLHFPEGGRNPPLLNLIKARTQPASAVGGELVDLPAVLAARLRRP